jgi:hypothetical protein
VDLIETEDIQLAAYALARGGKLLRVVKAERPAFRLEGLRLTEAEIDFAHFGPHDVEPEDFDWHLKCLTSLWGVRL